MDILNSNLTDEEKIKYLLDQVDKLKSQQKLSQNLLEKLVHERTKELEEHKEMYRTLSRVSPVGIFRSNHKGDLVYVNKKWLEFCGLRRKEVLGRGWYKAIYEVDRKRIANRWEKAVKNEDKFFGECRFVTPKGKINWVLIQANVVNGGGQGHVGTVTNINNQKIIIPKLEALKSSLDDGACERNLYKVD